MLTLDPGAYAAAIAGEDGLLMALLLLLFSGVSLTLGQSAVLLANQVRPRRFLFSLLGGSFIYAIGALLWAVTLFLTTNILLGVEIPLRTAAILVALSYCPYLFGFWVFVPYLGNIWYVILRIWVFMLLVIATGHTLSLGFWPALVACGLGWVLLELLSRLPLFDTTVWKETILRLATGTPEFLPVDELADRLAEESRPGNHES